MSYQAFFTAIDQRLGSKLKAEGIKPQLLGFAWMEAAEREYTYLSISGRYVIFQDVFQALFYRMLWMAGIEEPRKFATDEDNEYIMEQYTKLQPRPGLKECFAKLRAAGFTVKALTAGDLMRVGGYFKQSGIDLPADDLVSCDTIGVAKPAPGAYTPLLEKLGKSDSTWFAAAHMWDVSAAKRAGFRGAYCTIWEKEPCSEIFGVEMDVVTNTLEELADGIIAATPA